MQIDHYLRSLVEKDASDLHFIAGQPPRMRMYGELTPFEEDILTADRTEEILMEIMSDKALADLEEHDSADFAYMIKDVARFRVNVMRHLNGLGGVFRAIPAIAKTLEDLKMPPVLKRM
jgi:twitching motility protein PilT